ncbi:spore coat protein GerQ [Halalkalibacter hemicellulosilyticus]|uniref:Spore coat protein GerQ n=1 Tax=Halalkalibacter hemicellulosilyticusJCM 9152 TaxID=1236971 RepID=W4QDK0_9BACI|nr:spore coat protein GerQ [Halalkalibacter hemicellulosilyticus]GAE29768.1 hypothetical protein JCM9152_1149 [Halalkalibacter hemicellulosilyticusJCM 9152]
MSQQWYQQQGQQPMQAQTQQGQTQQGLPGQPGGVPYFSSQQYQTPGFAQAQQFQPLGGAVPGYAQPQQTPGMLPIEQSYIENILRLNRGKVASFYMTYENNEEWNAKIFRGIVEEAGRDHIIVSEVDGSHYYILLMVNLDYVEFDEPIEYDYPFAYGPVLTQYSPRPE